MPSPSRPSPSPWTDLDRPPLSERALRTALVRPDGFWQRIRVVPETGSTNADLALAAREGAPEGTVLVAEAQTAGHGRLGRTWVSPPRAGLTFSVLLRPEPAVGVQHWGWLPLLAGVAVARAVGRLGQVEAVVKWPNDVLLEEPRGKVAGVLSQADGGAVVLGIGLNVSTRREELPRADATSLALEGSLCIDRDPLLRGLLRQLATEYTGWRDAGGDPEASGLRTAYTEICDTIGRRVRISLPSGGELVGVAVGIAGTGGLVVRTDTGERTISAGDVVHVR